MKTLTIACIAGLAILLTACGEAPSEPPPVIATSVAELEKAYDDNEVAAQLRFGGNWVRVTGIVSSISLDADDQPYISLEGDGFDVGASFAPGEAANVARLSKDGPVQLLCGEVSEILGNPKLGSCHVEFAQGRLVSVPLK